MFSTVLLGMMTMLIILLLNTYHLASHTNKRKKFFYDLRHYFWDDPHLYKEGVDGIIRCCVPEHEQEQILRKVTPKLMEDIMRETELPIRYCNLVFICLLSSRMPVSLSYLVMNVKE